MRMDWLAFAIAGMVFLSISNILVKLLATDASMQKLLANPTALYIPAALAALAIASALYIIQAKYPALLPIAAGIAIFALAGTAMMFLALRTGKAALVTAVLSLSTILVAVLSFVFLGDRFAAKETAALALATLSLLILVL